MKTTIKSPQVNSFPAGKGGGGKKMPKGHMMPKGMGKYR